MSVSCLNKISFLKKFKKSDSLHYNNQFRKLNPFSIDIAPPPPTHLPQVHPPPTHPRQSVSWIDPNSLNYLFWTFHPHSPSHGSVFTDSIELFFSFLGKNCLGANLFSPPKKKHSTLYHLCQKVLITGLKRHNSWLLTFHPFPPVQVIFFIQPFFTIKKKKNGLTLFSFFLDHPIPP